MVQKPFITEGMHLEHVQRHRRVRRTIEDMCFSWGYRPVETPLLDEYDSYRNHLSHSLDSDSYRLIDRSGKVLLLRSDITLFLAHQLGRHLTADELPLRVSYADSIVRYQSADEIHSGDTFQAGAELIGVGGTEGDAEILLMAAGLFRELEVPDPVLHIGSRHLLTTLWPQASGEQLEAIAEAVRYRRHDELSGLPAAVLPTEHTADLLLYIGESDENLPTELLTSLPVDSLVRMEAERIQQLARLVQDLEPAIRIRVDFSEVGARDYYSGMAFQMYCPGAPRAVAGGGRYDGLLGDFGFEASSVGFSVVQSVIEPLAKSDAIHPQPQPIDAPEHTDFRERFTAAQKLRSQGKAVHL